MESLEPRLQLTGTVFEVDSLLDTIADDGAITLREAIVAANTNTALPGVPAGSASDVDRIEFRPDLANGSIELTGGQFAITDEIEIVGLGAETLTIDAQGMSRIFEFSIQATVSGLTLTGGAQSNGGAVRVNSSATVLLDGLRLIDNAAPASNGGAIYNTGGTLTLVASTVASNTSQFGGGVYTTGSGQFVARDSLFHANTATGSSSSSGGGVYADGNGTLRLINSTLSGNRAEATNSSRGGGGVYSAITDARLINVTVVDNIANTGGSGGGLYRASGTFVLENTVVSRNTASTGPDVRGDYSTLSDYNLLGRIDGSSGLDQPNTQFGTSAAPLDELLGPLADNGGPTLTHLAWDVSPLLDAGDAARAVDESVIPLMFDQRGDPFSRVVGAVDIGATEGSRAVAFDLTGPVGTFGIGETIVFQWDPATVPVTSTARFFYDVDGVTNGNEIEIDSGVPVSLDGTFDWTPDLLLPEGDYFIGAEITLGNGDVRSSRLSGPISLEFGGATFVVTSLEDNTISDGLITLREAVLAANANASVGDAPAGSATSVDLIRFDAGLAGDELVLLASLGDLPITDGLVISGLGLEDLTIRSEIVSGSIGASRHFSVLAGVRAAISGLTLSTGGTLVDGGSIHNAGELGLQGVRLSGNTSQSRGGAIYNTGQLTITDSQIEDNRATNLTNLSIGSGGGIYNEATLTLRNVSIDDNVANVDGGGIYNAGDLDGVDITISRNVASSRGGAIISFGAGSVTLANATIDRNFGFAGGGAIWIEDGALRLTDADIDDNSNGLSTADGGGIYLGDDATLMFTRGSLSGNTTQDDGGGLFVASGAESRTLRDVQIDDNESVGGSGGGVYDQSSSSTLQITGGSISRNIAQGSGGGLYDQSGTAIVDGVDILDNTALTSNGGGVFFSSITATVLDTQIAGNRVFGAAVSGGGLYHTSGTLSIERARFISNAVEATSNGRGGGLYVNQANTTVIDSTFDRNSVFGAIDGLGGGISFTELSNSSNTLTIAGSTLSGNSVYGADDARGGGLAMENTTQLRLTNSTVSGNRVFGSADALGGGLSVLGGLRGTLTNITVTLNEANAGGGIWAGSGTILRNSIVAGNNALDEDREDVVGSFGAGSLHNLIGVIFGSAGLETSPTNLFGTNAAPRDAGLAALADNGGPTKTHALMPGSDAIDAGDLALALDPSGATLLSDQRGDGFDRVLGAGVDIGAFEGTVTGVFTLTGPAGQSVLAGETVRFTWDNASLSASARITIVADPDTNVPGDEITILNAGDPSVLAGVFDWPSVALPEGAYTFRAIALDPIANTQQQSELAAPTTIDYSNVYVVNSLADIVAMDGVLTLREAIQATNSNQLVGDASAGRSDAIDIITFDAMLLDQRIDLTFGELEISDDLAIFGLGQTRLTIAGDETFRLIRVFEGVSFWLEELTLTDGSATGSSGGALWNEGEARLSEVRFVANTADVHAGAVFNTGTLIVEGGRFEGNFATVSGGAVGGAVFNDNAEAFFRGTTFAGNFANNRGGAIFNNRLLSLESVSLESNGAASGGAIWTDYFVDLVDSLVSLNLATGTTGGGGVFVDNGAFRASNTVFSGNAATLPSGDGGAIYDRSSYTLLLKDGVALINNTAGENGGGLFDRSGRSALLDTRVEANSAGGNGGGLYFSSVTLFIADSLISTNTLVGSTVQGGGVYATSTTGTIARTRIIANSIDGTIDALGGGVFATSGQLSIVDTSIEDNRVFASDEGYGGGVFVSGTSSNRFTIERSTVAGNNVFGASISRGAGIAARNADSSSSVRTIRLNVVNSTVSGNRAFGAADAQGGGVHTFDLNNDIVELAIINSTFTLNEAAIGGGINQTAGGGVLLRNSIVAGNRASDTATDVRGAFSNLSGSNLIGEIDGSTGLADEPSNLFGTLGNALDASLGALADNGGLTRTHALLEGSPAIDAGNNAFATSPGSDGVPITSDDDPLRTDQRGGVFKRFDAGVVDIGAFEGSVAQSFVLAGPTGLVNAGVPQQITWQGSSVPASSLISIFADPDGIINGNEITLLESGDPNVLAGAFTWFALDVPEGSYTIGATLVNQVSGQVLTDRLLAPVTISYAGAFVVNSLADVIAVDGVLTLREALLAAETNAAVGDASAGLANVVDVIVFDAAIVGGQTIALTLGGFTLTGDVAIQGPAGSGVRIDGLNSARIFDIAAGARVWMDDLTLVNGRAVDGAGGGVRNAGTLVLRDVRFEDSEAFSQGGGLANLRSGDLDAAVVTFVGNTAANGGGLSSEGRAVIRGLDVQNNTASGSGGGLFLDDRAETRLSVLTVIDNEATNGSGGGLYIAGGLTDIDGGVFMLNTARSGGGIRIAGGAVTLLNAHLSDNEAIAGAGGGLASSTIGSITITNVDFVRNRAIGGSNGDGGGIQFTNNATRRLTDVLIDANTATGEGGGLYSSGGFLFLTNAVVTNNVSSRSGGGAYLTSTTATIDATRIAMNQGVTNGGGLFSSTLTLRDSEISDNIVTGNTAQGGGLYASSTLTISRTEILRNRAEGASDARGGGVYASTTSSLTESTIANNEAFASNSGNGGGLYVSNGQSVIRRSTISGNSVFGATDSRGGGIIAVNSSNLVLINSTVSGNLAFGAADARGGGIDFAASSSTPTALIISSTITLNEAAIGGGVARSSGTVTLFNTISAQNLAATDGADVFGAFDSNSNANLIGVVNGSTGLTDGPDTMFGDTTTPLDALLGALSLDPEASTRTHALLPGSPAIDAGDETKVVDQLNQTIVTDQRGGNFQRRIGIVDIGAYEGATDTFFSLTSPAAATLTASRETPIRWTGNVPANAQISLFYTTDGTGQTDRNFIVRDASYVALDGEFLWASSQVADGDYFIGAVVNVPDPVNPGMFTEAFVDLSAQFTLVNEGVAVLYEVNSLADVVAADGVLTLREALEAANTNTAVGDAVAGNDIEIDEITFADALIGQVITLTSELSITDDVLILGVGAGDFRLQIDAAGTGRVFSVASDVSASIAGLRLSGGSTSGDGGAIFNAGDLTLNRLEVFANSASNGGAIAVNNGSLSINETWIHDNAASGGNGGGVFAQLSDVRILASTLSGNAARFGGGLYAGIASTVTISNSTLSGNAVSGSGAEGGGLYAVDAAEVSIISTTVANNSAGSGGGGLRSDGGSIGLINSIVALNTAPAGPDALGEFLPSDYNLIGADDGSTGLDGANAILGTTASPIDPLLDTLTDNGGPTPTHAIASGLSDALDAGLDTGAVDPDGAPLPFDQRGAGQDRIRNGRVDLGAFEFTSTPDDNLAPEIEGLTISDDPIAQGSSLTLEAFGVSDDSGVAAVSFYLDANNDGVGTPDELLGIDADGADGWSFTGVVTWGPGQARYLAQATDDGAPVGVKTSDFAEAVGTVVAAEPPRIELGDVFVRAGETMQAVQLFVSGTDLITGVRLRAQIGDGQGGSPEPTFAGIDLAGSIFSSLPTTITGGPIPGAESLLDISVLFVNTGVETQADGLLATLMVDTSGFNAGESFALSLTIDDPGLGTEFIVFGGQIIEPTLTPGTLNLFDSEVRARQVFYNNSAFDGDDDNANAGDDNALATDKAALQPGETATLSNYTSYVRGLNGIAIDIFGLSNPAGLSASDFEFRVGTTNDTSSWVSAPAPINDITADVRLGAGVGGADRIAIIFADGAIVNTWLEVRVIANANTGLAQDDVFYFGNAIGETGNAAGNTFVDGADFAGVRDNPHNFLNPAGVTDRFDMNRDRFVDGVDLAIVRDNFANFLSALPLITPSSGALAAEAKPNYAANALVPDALTARSEPITTGFTLTQPSLSDRATSNIYWFAAGPAREALEALEIAALERVPLESESGATITRVSEARASLDQRPDRSEETALPETADGHDGVLVQSESAFDGLWWTRG